MTGSKQTIGDISESRNVHIRQVNERASEQSVGAVSRAVNVDIQQLSFAEDVVAVREALIGLERYSDSDRSAAITKLQKLLEEEAPEAVVSAQDLQASVEEVARLLPPDTQGRSLLTDASIAVSLISGSVAVATLADPYLLAVAAPACLAATGYLQRSKLPGIYGKIRQLLSGNDGGSPD